VRFCLSAILVIIPLSQASAKTVVAHDDARDCYFATLAPTSADNFEQRLAACDRAIGSVGDNAQLHAALLVNRADIRLLMQDYKGTVSDAEASIALDPDLSAAYLNRGAGLVGLQRYGEALPALEKAIALGITEKSHLAYFNLAIAEEQLGDVRGAYDDYKRALEVNPDFSPAKEQLARFKVVTRSN
jgi:tetratricopeptide (TPR) repeat protein